MKVATVELVTRQETRRQVLVGIPDHLDTQMVNGVLLVATGPASENHRLVSLDIALQQGLLVQLEDVPVAAPTAAKDPVPKPHTKRKGA
jgi:hypothetical protein